MTIICILLLTLILSIYIKYPDGTIATDLYHKPTRATPWCMHPVHIQDLWCIAFPMRRFWGYAEIAQRKIFVHNLMPFVGAFYSGADPVWAWGRHSNRALAHARISLLYGPSRNKQSDILKIVTQFSAHHQQLRTTTTLVTTLAFIIWQPHS